MLTRCLPCLEKVTSLPCHFDFAGELDIEMQGFDLSEEKDFVNFEIFVRHLFVFQKQI